MKELKDKNNLNNKEELTEIINHILEREMNLIRELMDIRDRINNDPNKSDIEKLYAYNAITAMIDKVKENHPQTQTL